MVVRGSIGDCMSQTWIKFRPGLTSGTRKTLPKGRPYFWAERSSRSQAEEGKNQLGMILAVRHYSLGYTHISYPSREQEHRSSCSVVPARICPLSSPLWRLLFLGHCILGIPTPASQKLPDIISITSYNAGWVMSSWLSLAQGGGEIETVAKGYKQSEPP